MILRVAIALLSITPLVLGGQIPVVEGVLGGVPSHVQSASRVDLVKTKAKLSTEANTPGALRIVENSGVCETTKGVYQASGYGDLTSKNSVWFWFFEARSNPDTAPLAIWLNGGPGSSSMIGLFQENGPCRIQNDTKTVALNPYSWNEKANMLYIDQPIGVGFSYGDTTVGTSQEAASDVWKFLQIFFSDSRFSKYAKNEFAIWTESYGGHYGPTFAAYFLDQNKAIANGTVTGTPINLKYLGVGDGLTDPLSQYPGYISYASSNPYHALVSSSTIKTANTSYYKSNGCQDKIQACYDSGSTSTCSSAQSYCNNNILSPLVGNYDVYYVLSKNPDSYPPDITSYLSSSSLHTKIGAHATWQETNDDVYSNFASTGDWMHNSRLDLQTVIDSGVRTLIYDGDADYILNYMGVEAMVNNLQTRFTSEFAKQSFANYTVNGVRTGVFKNAGTFSYVRIFGAGHEVPAYKYGSLAYGQAALQFFSQIMSNQSLSST
ncbi:serine carboxypeptidase [Punctularia strigosozonata HHB-11173 SS5]|uniref:serine carboxypeptidase n=1 Tax=Punctularia strigosozonata (strain HHB-11173) TaxID=741275 RepID=UPI0004416893|nr:serine carboxypeptidase [Punctularia strigosozonata HHB-11173 SS5]EIN08494.1 serine carboxypeptidase [Punctularia strigosozonata HHB-11173 SS5]